jgi:predicted membrane-bound dolichyl-phosphate-mannose-protein mannosyltransferase
MVIGAVSGLAAPRSADHVMQNSVETTGPEKNSTRRAIFDLNLGYKWDRLFLVLLLVSIALRVVWLDAPNGYGTGGTLIFDEYYYVNVARNLLGWPQGPDPSRIPYPNALPGTDPNQEHPPLAKLMIAASMRILGDNAWGWRVPSVIMGSLAILLFYLLMKRVSKNGKYSLLATFLFCFDTLVYVDSRIAILDIFTLAFMVLGFYLYFLERRGLSAVALALSTLTKIGGFYGFLVIVIFHLLRDLRPSELVKKWKTTLIPKLKWLIPFGFYYAATGFILLLVLDRFASGSDPFAHIRYIYQYTLALVRPVPTGIESQPLDWLLNQVPIPYLGVSVSSGGVTYQTIAFWGAMNSFIIYLTIPAMAYVLYRYDQRNSQLALFLLCWFAATYFPFFPLAYISHRISYIFYFQNTVPAVAGAIALIFSNKHVPRSVVLVYALLVLVGFAWYFPFKQVP